jgi:endonuclease/exonuclease/phosphatase family metal-dependent hydrolase
VIFLQETTIIPGEKYDQTIDLQKALGFSASAFTSYGNTHEYQSARIGGIGILSKWPFTICQNKTLPPGTLDQYGARSGLLVKTSNGLILATTHLSYRPEEKSLRTTQTEEFLEQINREETDMVIIGGDFNALPDEPAIIMMEKHFKDSGNRHPTYKEHCIDYLFHSENLTTEEVKVVLDDGESDHRGLLAIYSIQTL